MPLIAIELRDDMNFDHHNDFLNYSYKYFENITFVNDKEKLDKEIKEKDFKMKSDYNWNAMTLRLQLLLGS